MAFSEFEIKLHSKTIGDFIDTIRPPAHIRNKLDISFRLKGQSIEVFEVGMSRDGHHIETPIAKARYIKSQNIWKVYWMRADEKWHAYETSEVARLSDFVEIIKEDKHSCFWG